MLNSISIKDFAIIEDLYAEFGTGLNIITGETGAGKSVIIEAVSMALGSRADTSYIRSGKDKAIVELVVDTDDCDLSSYLDEIGVPSDNPLIIRREINRDSKSICRINGCIVPLSSLSGMCKKIADIHGQYDQQVLLDSDNHISILDLFGGNNVLTVREKVSDSYNQYAQYSSSLYSLKKSISDSERQRDFLKFELDEIRKADLKIGEDENLEEAIRMMENGEKLYGALSSAHSAIFGSDYSADSMLGNALRSLEEVKGISKEIDELTERISNTFYELDDMNGNLRTLRDSVSFSQAELDKNIERLEEINKLKRKYGGSIEAALEYASEAEKKLSDIENADDQIKDLEDKIKLSKAQFDHDAGILTVERKKAAKSLEGMISSELRDLNFSNSDFVVEFEVCSSSANGTDKVEFLISANRGEKPKPLAKTSSGGELSRIMLALKRIIGDIDGIPTMIFDEIDTGISGATAAVVGDKLTSISENHQILCITHLPQIACKGKSHLRIFKQSNDESTQTSLEKLNEDQRIEEIARLLSAAEVTDTARMQAKELLGIK